MQAVAGQLIAHYRLIEPIGERRGGALWRAEDTTGGREVFLEIIAADAIAEGRRMRLVRELNAVREARHPFFEATLEVRTDLPGGIAVVREPVVGVTLAAWADAERRPLAELLRVAMEAAEAVSALHAAGLCHGDLRAERIRVSPSGHIKLTGLGTWPLAVGEVADDDDAMRAADVATLGEVLRAFLPADGKGTGISESLADVLRRTSLAAPGERPRAAEISAALDAAALGEDDLRRARARVDPSTGRLRILLGVAALALVGAVGAFAVWRQLDVPSRGGGGAGYDLAILPLVDARAGTLQHDHARELARRLSEMASPARVQPDAQVERALSRGSAQPAVDWISPQADYTLRWMTGDHSTVEPAVQVSLLGGDGSLQQAFGYPLHGDGTVPDGLEGKVASDVEAFLFSVHSSTARFQRSYKQLRSAPMTWSPRAAQLFVRAITARHQGKEWTALDAVDEALSLDGEFAQARRLRSQLLEQLQWPYEGSVMRRREVARALAARNRLEPWELELVERESRYLESGPDPALGLLDPALTESLGRQARLESHGLALQYRGEIENRIDLVIASLVENPEPDYLWIWLARALLDSDRSLAVNLERVAPLTAAHPGNPLPLVLEASLRMQERGGRAQADSLLSRARELGGGLWVPRLGWWVAYLEISAGRWDRAEFVLNEALAVASSGDATSGGDEDPRLYAGLFEVYLATGRLGDAGDVLGIYRRRLPGNPWADLAQARLQQQQGDGVATLAALDTAIERDPAYQDARFARAEALMAAGEYPRALEDFRIYVQQVERAGSDPRLDRAQRAIRTLSARLG